MVCSCAMSSNCVWLKCLAANNILLKRKWNHDFLLLGIALVWKMVERFVSRRYSLKNKLGDRMIKQYRTRVIAKYSQTSLIRTPKGQNQVCALQRCPYYRGRECMIIGISGTKQTVRNREVSVTERCPYLTRRFAALWIYEPLFTSISKNNC